MSAARGSAGASATGLAATLAATLSATLTAALVVASVVTLFLTPACAGTASRDEPSAWASEPPPPPLRRMRPGSGQLDPQSVPAPGLEAVSLLGAPLAAPPLTEAERARFEAELKAVSAAHDARPGEIEPLIAYARRLGQLGRFRESVAVYSDALRQHPHDARLYRFRGHRYITLRQFDRAVADLTRASQLVEGRADVPEPGLEPNARGVVLDTLQENIWYHLALAHYLRGDWAQAYTCWQRCARLAPNDDGRVMAAYWSANAASRLGRMADAKAAVSGITAGMDVIEYHAYHQLALMWKGERDGDALLALARGGAGGAESVDYATLGYGVATWHRARGEREACYALLDEVACSPAWNAFGCIAAEADQVRDGRVAAR